jgi:hypothetical protein
MTGKVYFVDIITEYGPGHFIAQHVTLERCAEILNANYIAVVDQDCPPFTSREKLLRVLDNSRNPNLHGLTQLAKRKQLYRVATELKTQLSSFIGLSFRIRSVLKNTDNNATSILIYLDLANPLQMIAVWLSVSSLVDTRDKTIVWTHFHRATGWQETRVGQIARRLINTLPIKTWNTTFTNEISAEYRKYGWNLDVLPVPLPPSLNRCDYNRKAIDEISAGGKKYDRLICWLLVTRREQGLDLLQKMIDHESTVNLPKKFIKCFVSEKVNIQENDNVELVRLPFGLKDYYLRFNECDVVLLPYSADSYNCALSMVFVEAVATYKIPIVSDGTVMASELKRFNLGGLVLDFDNEFSWTKINEIRENVSFRERLNLMAACYARNHDTFAYAESLYKYLKQRDPKIALAEPKRL